MVRLVLLILGLFALDAAASAKSRALFVPVFRTDFPDPFVLPVRGGFLAYATNAQRGRANIQMAESSNLIDWRSLRDGDRLHDAMPELPTWAERGKTWAPEVIAHQGRYLLYFTARERRSGLQCVGVATSADPRGAFVSPAPEPLVCQRAEGGSIDPSPFRDADGSLHLLYKSDGNNPAFLKPAQIFVQQLSTDGLMLAGEAHALLRNDQHWEWRVIESPTMVRDAAGRYTLLFSANHFGWEADQRLSNYGMGYALCASLTGPCTKAKENPVLRSYNSRAAGCLSGPGHQTVFNVAGRALLVFHAWATATGCTPGERARYMYIAPLAWDAGKPVIGESLRPAGDR